MEIIEETPDERRRHRKKIVEPESSPEGDIESRGGHQRDENGLATSQVDFLGHKVPKGSTGSQLERILLNQAPISALEESS